MRVYRMGNVVETDGIQLDDIWFCPRHNKFSKACRPMGDIFYSILSGVINWNEARDWGEGLPEDVQLALREKPFDVHDDTPSDGDFFSNLRL